jgi:hypothetical protein
MDDFEKFTQQAFNFFVEEVSHVVEETQKMLQDVGEQAQTLADEMIKEGERQCNEWFNQQPNYSSQPREELRRKLIPLVHGDWNLANRLLQLARKKNPGHSEDWYWEKVIYDLERDHWR